MASPRDWTEFQEKVLREGRCRIGHELCEEPEAAHIIQRSRIPGPDAMHPLNCVPLCREHHRGYDDHRLDLLPYLTYAEQGYAASLVGLQAAYLRIASIELPA